MEFKIPSSIPQDLQLIQDLVADIAQQSIETAKLTKRSTEDDDSILSSDEDDAASEKEVEADILGVPDDEEPLPSSDSSDSSDDESSSDSEPDEGANPRSSSKRAQEHDLDDDEEAGQSAVVSPEQMRTKNEAAELNVVIPDVEEVGANEVMEKVGEIMSIIDKVVIVKGTPSQVLNRASERALDSDTLLVFEDRKVLGYVWETFGPTTLPFYRVQFSDAYPLDAAKVQVSRAVFHIPTRSNFVFVSHLKHMKGSDASNAHDEEPAEDELEFSDDEAEREHKRSLKERRGGSEVPSRHTTPAASHMRDLDMAEDLYGASPYDQTFNDMDFGAGPSRPPPVPYDDPYSDSYGLPEASVLPVSPVSPPSPSRTLESSEPAGYPDRPRGRGRGRGKPPARDGGGRERGRGRGQERRRGDRGRGRGRGRGGGSDNWNGRQPPAMTPPDEYDPRTSRSMSPTSIAIARATGQYPGGGSQPENDWAYQQQQPQQQYPTPYDFNIGYQQQYVQPHINPRFASMFGMGVGHAQEQQGTYGQDDHGQGMWRNDWSAQHGIQREDGSRWP